MTSAPTNRTNVLENLAGFETMSGFVFAEVVVAFLLASCVPDRVHLFGCDQGVKTSGSLDETGDSGLNVDVR
jgi:hypothetical protein